MILLELNPYFFISVKSSCILEVKSSFSSHAQEYQYLIIVGRFFSSLCPLTVFWASDNYSSAIPTVKMYACFAGKACYLWRGEGRSPLGTIFATGKGNCRRLRPVTKPVQIYPPCCAAPHWGWQGPEWVQMCDNTHITVDLGQQIETHQHRNFPWFSLYL